MIREAKDDELLERLLWTYRGLMKTMKTLSNNEAPQRISVILSMMEIMMEVDAGRKCEKDVRNVVHQARSWVSKTTRQDYMSYRLRCFAGKAAVYAENMKNSQAELSSIAKITNALNNSSKQQTPK